MGGCQLYEQGNVAKLKSTFFPFYRNMIIKSESTSPWVGCSQEVHLSLSQLLQDIRPAIFTTLLHMWDASELKLIRGTTYVLDILCFSFHISHTCILPSRMRTLYWPSTWMWLQMVGLLNQARGVNSFLTQSQLGQTLVHLLPNKDKQHRREMDGWIDGWMDGWLLPGSTSGTNPSNAPLPPPASHNSVLKAKIGIKCHASTKRVSHTSGRKQIKQFKWRGRPLPVRRLMKLTLAALAWKHRSTLRPRWQPHIYISLSGNVVPKSCFRKISDY